MKTAIPLLFLAGILSLSSLALAGTYDEELSKLSGTLGDAVQKAGLKTVAMGGFKDLQGKDTNLGKLLAEDLSVDLVNQKGVSVVDRANLNRIMEEYKLTEEGLIDPENTKKLKLAGIDAIIFGTITPFEGTYRVALKAIATDSAMIVAATRGSITETENLDALMGVTKLQPAKPGQTAEISKAADSDSKPAEPKRQSVYDLGGTIVEIRSVSFLRKSARVRVVYSVTNKRDTRMFSYHLTDRNAGPNDPRYYTAEAARQNGGKPDVILEGEATDDKGQTYKPLLPADVNSAPSMPANVQVSFTMEYQMAAEEGSTVQIPEKLNFSFEFFVGYQYSVESSGNLLKFSAVDYPIDKVQ